MDPRDSRDNDQILAAKGDPIRVIGGKYEGFTAYLDKTRGPMPKMVAIILEGDSVDGKSKVYKGTSIRKTNISMVSTAEPKNKSEAVLKQIPKIDKLLTQLCQELALCGLGVHPTEIDQIFMNRRMKYALEFEMRGCATDKCYNIKYNPNKRKNESSPEEASSAEDLMTV